MTAVFARLTKTVLAHLGEDGFLRDSEPVKVHVDRNIEMVDREGNVFVATHVLTLDNSVNALPNDSLEVNFKDATGAVVLTENFTLERRVDDNGYSTRFIARKE